ncbi:terminase small subunit [Amycolatopsis solani]|uniref:terminase small subunit n=1 Tax=Amycolatopsis solani TaxID=3028615 RepID=UPI00296F68DB|nr:hypothetical protein [Amycolatopsis sp. MEP2-6]
MTAERPSTGVPTTMAKAVRAAVGVLETSPEDAGAVALAQRLGEAIDEESSGRTIAELAGRLLAVLESLGATPAARKALAKGVPADDAAKKSALDELRKRREQRKRG